MSNEIDLDAVDYALPPECIAQEPAAERDAARLLVLERASGTIHHAFVRDLPEWLAAGDLVVRNATRVVPARLRGRKETGGGAEALLLRAGDAPGEVVALVKTRGRLRPGIKFGFDGGESTLEAELSSLGEDGEVTLTFAPDADPYAAGEMPLPPYIRRDAAWPADAERYQTIFARVPGSIAAPTAGLHFTEALDARLEAARIARAEVVLHVGVGTFRPLRAEDLARKRLHEERFELPDETAAAIGAARARGGRVVAVGTTTTRVLESRAAPDGGVHAGAGATDLFLYPGCRFSVVDALLTNFHLPRSSLMLLVAAFAGRDRLLDAYAVAIREGYRFYSYGDAMLIL